MSGIGADFGEYIIFADESGDHGLSSINPESPIFVLAFCIFKKCDYVSSIKSSIAKLKLNFWGHDLVVLHNHQIRKSEGAFSFLFDEEKRSLFLHLLNETIRHLPFCIVATAIDKRQLTNRANNNPYTLALKSCLEQSICFLEEHKQCEHLTHLIVESRGKSEDKGLALTFRELSALTSPSDRYPLDIKFAHKRRVQLFNKTRRRESSGKSEEQDMQAYAST